MTNEPFVLLAGIFGGFVGGLFGLLVAQYNAQAARQNKLMELEFDMYWAMIRRANDVLNRFEPERWNKLGEPELALIKGDLNQLKRDLILLAGKQKAVYAWKSFDDAIHTLIQLKETGVEATYERIPLQLVQPLLQANERLAEFQVEVRKILKGVG